MIVIGPFVERIVKKVGLNQAAVIGSVAVVIGVLTYALCGRYHYTFIAIALVLVAAGIRVTMTTATINVMRGLPADRTSIGAALNDTTQEIASGIGTAVVGILIAASVTGASWSPARTTAFQVSVTLGVLVLTATSVALLAIALIRTALDRKRNRPQAPEASTGPVQQP